MQASQVVIDDLVRKLNEETDLPFISEGTEEKVIRWAVETVAPHLPDYVVQFMASAADGLTDEEVKTFRTTIVREANKALDLPGLPEFAEERIIAFVVDGILAYARQGSQKP